MRFRRQPPVYSPVTFPSIWRAAVRAVRPASEPTAALGRWLTREYSAAAAVLFGSGTQALQVALRLALRRVHGSAVGLPAFTCFDVASAAVGVDAHIVLYDLDPATLAPDLDSLARVMERGVRVAVVSPLYGFPVDWEAIESVLAHYGGVGIEDAAQGFQARWRGRSVGSFGPISVLSFGRGKGWTGGVGGALLLRGDASRDDLETLQPEYAGWAAELRVVVLLLAQWALGRPGWYAIPAAIPWLELGETIYRDPTSPRAATRAAAACLERSRDAAEQEAAVRRANGLALLHALRRGSDAVTIKPLPGAAASFLRLPVRLSRGLAGFSEPARARRLGILRAYPSVLAELPQVSARMDGAGGRWPGAADLARTLFTAPTHSRLSTSEYQEMVGLLLGYRG